MGVVCGKNKHGSRQEQYQAAQTYISLKEIQDESEPEQEEFRVASKKNKRRWKWRSPTHSNSLQHQDTLSLIHPWGLTMSKENIKQIYSFDIEVGSGSGGTVHKAHYIKDPSKVYAIKTVKYKSLSSEEYKCFLDELDLVKELDCYFIASFFECYQTENESYIVLEYCEGGDLVTFVEKSRVGLDEALARKWFYQAASAVSHLHRFGIAHRDIKLDNFLITGKDPWKSDVKLIDFGFAKKYTKSQFRSRLGTPYYVAPEILDKSPKYSFECDNWSLGVMLYMMLFATIPFNGRNNAGIFESIKTKEINYSDKIFSKLSKPVIDLMKGLLTKDPAKRMTVQEALRSQWFTPFVLEYKAKWKPFLNASILTAMKASATLNSFQREVSRLMVSIYYDHEEVVTRKRLFTLIDTQKDEVLSAQELADAFTETGLECSVAEAERIILGLHSRTVGVLTFTEFVSASLSPSFFSDEMLLKGAFQRMDADSTGKITVENVKLCFARFGYNIDSTSLEELSKNTNLQNAGGTVTFEDFKQILSRSSHTTTN